MNLQLRPMRVVEVLAALAFLVIAAVVAFTISPAGAAGKDSTQYRQTPTGPLQPADVDFLVRVRQAGLWEIPAGQMAQQRSNNQRVKEVGQILASDHTKLDEQVRALAAKLQVALPAQPNADQRGWLNEMSAVTGPAFDKVFADRLRAAHGKVFTLVSAVRAGTKNNDIRAFAQVAVDVVMKHMTVLESTNNVNFADLPNPPAPSPNPS